MSPRRASDPDQPHAGRRATSRDVAAAAGVSRATVSYVLNGSDQTHRITPATRDRVLAVAERLGYEPNAVALALRAGRTEIVLVEFPNWPLGPPVAEAIGTMVESLEQLGYTPLIHFQRADPQRLARAGLRVQPIGVIGSGIGAVTGGGEPPEGPRRPRVDRICRAATPARQHILALVALDVLRDRGLALPAHMALIKSSPARRLDQRKRMPAGSPPGRSQAD